jgi:hypothetical protein
MVSFPSSYDEDCAWGEIHGGYVAFNAANSRRVPGDRMVA